MGLDMNLYGRKYRYDDKEMDEGFPVREVRLELAYWRKHPDLHGYIVQHFAGGIDECQEIVLDEDNIRQIIKAVEDAALPHTTGFFFGNSQDANQGDTIGQLTRALEWLETEYQPGVREVIYRASW